MADMQTAPKKWVPVGNWGFSIGVTKVSETENGVFYLLWAKIDGQSPRRLGRFYTENGKISARWGLSVLEMIGDFVLKNLVTPDFAEAFPQIFPEQSTQ